MGEFQLRLVVTAPVVRRALSLTGLDRMVPACPSLEAAVAAGTPVPNNKALQCGAPFKPFSPDPRRVVHTHCG